MAAAIPAIAPRYLRSVAQVVRDPATPLTCVVPTAVTRMATLAAKAAGAVKEAGNAAVMATARREAGNVAGMAVSAEPAFCA